MQQLSSHLFMKQFILDGRQKPNSMPMLNKRGANHSLSAIMKTLSKTIFRGFQKLRNDIHLYVVKKVGRQTYCVKIHIKITNFICICTRR
jgi:hypothetical protein